MGSNADRERWRRYYRIGWAAGFRGMERKAPAKLQPWKESWRAWMDGFDVGASQAKSDTKQRMGILKGRAGGRK